MKVLFILLWSWSELLLPLIWCVDWLIASMIGLILISLVLSFLLCFLWSAFLAVLVLFCFVWRLVELYCFDLSPLFAIHLVLVLSRLIFLQVYRNWPACLFVFDFRCCQCIHWICLFRLLSTVGSISFQFYLIDDLLSCFVAWLLDNVVGFIDLLDDPIGPLPFFVKSFYRSWLVLIDEFHDSVIDLERVRSNVTVMSDFRFFHVGCLFGSE